MLTQHDGISNGVKENYPCDGAGSPDLNPVLFQSREYDTDLGLYFNRARYYDPGIGRFTQRDLLRTNNRYVAFSNNPNYFFDPFGLEDCVRVTREKYTICDYVFWGTDNCNETARSDCYIACENCCFKDAAIAGAIFSMPLFPLYNMVLGATKAVKSVYDAFSNPVPDCIRKCRDNFVSQFKGDCQNQVDPGDNNGCPPDVPNCDEIIY